ncbi:hypothetical protein GQR58_007333 [Nymphon striatum]|nr:hypothetical protein GQR58_007333 [Nymphon striatum]
MSSFVQIGETSSVSRFFISAPDVAVRWKKWLRSFEIFLTARGVVNAIQQNALLLNIAGEEIMDLVDTFPDDRLVATDTSNVYGVLVKALNEHFRPLVNVPFERSIFRRADCSEEETVDVYATRLRKLAKSCEYGDNLDDIVRDQIIEKVHSPHLRRKFLEQGSSLTLSTLLNLSRTYESVEVQNSSMSDAISSSSVNAIRKTGTRDRSTLQSVMCYRCGYKGHRSDDRSCPAWKKTCAKCGEKDHFAKAKFCKGVSANFQSSTSGRRVWKNAVSRRDAVREVYSDDEDGILFHVGPAHGPTAVVTLSNKDKSVDIPVIIDSGASDNVMDWITYSGIIQENLDVKLSPSSKGLYDVSNNRLPLEGEFIVNVSCTDSAVSDSKFYVCKNVNYTLLSYETARSLRMIEISENVKGVKYDACSRLVRVTGDGGAQVLDLSQKVVENSTKNCYECQILGRPEPPVPLVSTKVPENAWEYLTTDLMGPLPNGEHVLVLVDYYSRYFELPTVERRGRLKGCESWKEKDTLNKFKMKEYSDERKGTKVHDVKVGNRVLVKVNKKQNKLTPEFERKPYEVTRVKGGEVECMNESRKIRRNESQLKKLNESIVESLNEDVQAGEDKSEQLEERSRARESVNNNLEEKELESNVSLTNRSRASESINNSLEEKDKDYVKSDHLMLKQFLAKEEFPKFIIDVAEYSQAANLIFIHEKQLTLPHRFLKKILEFQSTWLQVKSICSNDIKTVLKESISKPMLVVLLLPVNESLVLIKKISNEPAIINIVTWLIFDKDVLDYQIKTVDGLRLTAAHRILITMDITRADVAIGSLQSLPGRYIAADFSVGFFSYSLAALYKPNSDNELLLTSLRFPFKPFSIKSWIIIITGCITIILLLMAVNYSRLSKNNSGIDILTLLGGILNQGRIMEMREMGIIEKIVNKYIDTKKRSNNPEPKQVSVNQMLIMLIVLCAGIVSSLGILALECLLKR